MAASFQQTAAGTRSDHLPGYGRSSSWRFGAPDLVANVVDRAHLWSCRARYRVDDLVGLPSGTSHWLL